MKERERAIATGLTLLMLILWLGFLFHRSPRFAGSAWGGLLAVSGSLLMLFPLIYMVIKRIKLLKKWVTRFISMRTLLSLHVYAGIVGPILVLLHTGHKFQSPIGIALTALTIVVVLSGFVGRYMMQQFSTEIRTKKSMLVELRTAYDREAGELMRRPERARLLTPFSGWMGRLAATLFIREPTLDSSDGPHPRNDPIVAFRLAESIADVEFAIKTHEKFKTWFSKWLKVHIVLTIVLYALLAAHVNFAIYFGLRWFE